MIYLTALLISILVTIAVMPYVKEAASRLQVVDRPNRRKLHKHNMPRCGGVAMAAGAMVPVMLWAPRIPFTKGLLIGILIIVLFGVADDIKDLSPYTKLAGQLMAALMAVTVGGVVIRNLGAFLPPGVTLPDWVAMPLTIFVIIGVTNATNLSDGLDGLAGGLALLIFICIGYLAFSQKDWFIAMVSIAVGGAILGFLRFNSHPAQLFMGDAGSQFLGFIAILLSIQLTQQKGQLSVILPLIILGLPILDTITVMTKRIAKGRSPFIADKNHFHHRLMQIGLYHTEAVLTIYIAQSLLIVVAIIYHGVSEWILLGFYLCFASLVVGSFYYLERREIRINRDKFLVKVKTRLQPLKDRGRAIRIAFGILKIGVPALLLFNALVPAPKVTEYYTLFLGGFLLLLVLAWFVNRSYLDKAVKVGLYLLTPFVVYHCDQGLGTYMNKAGIIAYNSLYLVLLAAVFLTVKLTRRVSGFKSSTLDFLVIFIILLIPNLPNVAVKGYHMGLVAAKTVILFYSYEVLVGEMRKRAINLSVVIVAFIAVVSNFLVHM